MAVASFLEVLDLLLLADFIFIAIMLIHVVREVKLKLGIDLKSIWQKKPQKTMHIIFTNMKI